MTDHLSTQSTPTTSSSAPPPQLSSYWLHPGPKPAFHRSSCILPSFSPSMSLLSFAVQETTLKLCGLKKIISGLKQRCIIISYGSLNGLEWVGLAWVNDTVGVSGWGGVTWKLYYRGHPRWRTHMADSWCWLSAGSLAGAVNQSRYVCVTSPFGLHFSKYGSRIPRVQVPRKMEAAGLLGPRKWHNVPPVIFCLSKQIQSTPKFKRRSYRSHISIRRKSMQL